jgi:type IV pilus assembly protein PilX
MMPTSDPHRAGPPPRQCGAALIVGLVLLLVLTVLGISGMSTATLELTMANNAQFHQDAFQAAETGIDIAIGQRDFTTAGPVVMPVRSLANGSEVEAVTRFELTTPVPASGFSMGVGSGAVQAYHFETRASGRGARGAVSTHNQGFYVIGPGSN